MGGITVEEFCNILKRIGVRQLTVNEHWVHERADEGFKAMFHILEGTCGDGGDWQFNVIQAATDTPILPGAGDLGDQMFETVVRRRVGAEW
jgi:hypothetical protein